MRTIAIVGAGTAGCVVARQLADMTSDQTQKWRIVLIERGVMNPHHDDLDFMMSIGSHSRAVTCVDAQLTELRADHEMYPYVQGHCVGGGGAVNGMVVSPLHATDFELWRDEYGCTDWNPHSIMSRVEMMYESRQIASSDVGVVGKALIAAGAQPATLTWNGKRISGASLISDVVANGTVELLHARTTGLLIDGGHVRGVQTDSGVIHADVVVLTAGSIITPLLLREAGIQHVYLGEHAQDHPSVFFTVERPSPSEAGLNATALAALGDVQLIAYESSHPDTPMFGGISLSLLNVASRGRVVGTTQQPQLELRLLRDHDDLVLLCDAMRQFIVHTVPVIEKHCGPVFCDSHGSTASSLMGLNDHELGAWLLQHVVPHSHVVGTCAMGQGAHAVVSQRGEVSGARGLYVADASVCPRIPRSNTNMVVAAVAAQMSQFIGEDLS